MVMHRVVFFRTQGDGSQEASGEITYDGERRINGDVVDFASWPLIENPFVTSKVGSGRLELRYGERMRTLDYTTWSVRDGLL